MVSKNGLTVIHPFAIESKIRREGPLQLTDLLDRLPFRSIAGYLEVPFTCNRSLDFVSLFEVECFNNHSGKTDCQTVTPFGNPHRYAFYTVYLHERVNEPALTLHCRHDTVESVQLTLQLPDELAAHLGGEAVHEQLERRALEAFALEELRAGRITELQLRQMLGLARIQLDGFLKSHGIYQHYTLEDFEQERQALKELGI